MPTTTLRLPFTLHQRQGVVAVRYGPNAGPEESGFDILPNMPFDIALCRGYPTVHAEIAEYAGTGYRTVCGWVQLVTNVRYSAADPARQNGQRVGLSSAGGLEAALLGDHPLIHQFAHDLPDGRAAEAQPAGNLQLRGLPAPVNEFQNVLRIGPFQLRRGCFLQEDPPSVAYLRLLRVRFARVDNQYITGQRGMQTL